MSLQEQLNTQLRRTALQYEDLSLELQDFAINEFGRIRLELVDLLMRYTTANDVININRINALLTDLNGIEQLTRQVGLNVMTRVAEASATASVTGSLGAMATVGINSALTATAPVFNRISAEVVRYVLNRFGADGLTISDRVWALSAMQRNELEGVLRSGIIRGESVSTLIAKVRKVYDNDTWKIKRLVVTEGNIAYRTGSAYVAQQSKVVKGLRIHRGEADKEEHRCTQLEQIDRYGLGKGVYKPDDPEVLNPHPNCTSYTTYELIEEKAVKKEPYVDPTFRNEGFDYKFGKTPSGSDVLFVQGQPLNLNGVGEEGMKQLKQIAKTTTQAEFINAWSDLEDKGVLNAKTNQVLKRINALYEVKNTLFKVPEYKVGFGRVNTAELGGKAFKWGKALNADEIEAIASYTGSTSTAINNFWRQGLTDNDDVLEKTKHLDSAISKSVLKENVMLYRGAGYDAIGGKLAMPILQGNKDEVIGATIQDMGFMSTSLGADSKFDKEVTFQIMAKKGTKGMYVEDYTSTKGEMEVILARGTKMRIKDVNTFGSKIHLLVEVIN